MSTVIKVENVTKGYRLGQLDRRSFFSDWKKWFVGKEMLEDDPNAFWALKGVTFDIEQGQVVGILGRNGAGKSTLLKILSMITAPTAGRVRMKGRVASLLEVGTGFHLEYSGRDNIFMNGAILGMTRREVAAKFDEIVAFSGVEQFIDTPVKRYSSGMRVRLAFAVAAHLEAEILIIDEVLSVGDAAFQQKCIGKMGSVAQDGRTVLFVSHHAAAVEALCTRGLVLERGQVGFDGTQSEALAFYASRLETSGMSLHERPDRSGNGALQAVAVELRTTSGQPLAVPFSGQDVELWLRYEKRTSDPLPELNVRITVLTELGVPVFTHFNHVNRTLFGPLPQQGTFVCRLPRLALASGRYRLDYRLATRHRSAELLDALEGALRFTVEGGDFYGTGTLPEANAGVALVDAAWRLEVANG